MLKKWALIGGGLVLALIVIGAVAGGGGKDTSSGTAPKSDAVKERPGNAVVYQRIEALTDCRALQGEFDTASTNHDRELKSGDVATAKITTTYMEAANDRMKTLKC